MFVDEARIIVKAGDGGQGCESYFRDKSMRYPRPDGGDGGQGGQIVFTADKSVHTLLDYKYKQHYKAARGGNASSRKKQGKNGKDCILRVPIGTVLRDHNNQLIIKDLTEHDQSVIVCKGGQGGIGNARRREITLPQEGEERIVDLELKVIADIGLIGFPNAGKSTLISKISSAKSKVASYPFTTKQPILGVVTGEDFHFVVADLPGIIKGAHEGKGLGDRFLRHAERTKVLVHVIDMGATEGRDPLDDFERINYELEQYSENLLFKSKLVVANKMDVDGAQEHLKRFQKKYGKDILSVSALKKEGLVELIDRMKALLC